MKTIFENNGGTYESQGDYLLPNLTLQDDEQYSIGVWGMRHKRYLKQHHKVIYYNLLTAGKLNSYLADIEEQSQNLFSRMVNYLTEKENVTEKLKAENALLWVRKMNNIRNRATEIVNEQVIYN
ncbi:MAG: TnpV protein [Ruminococcus sp.]|uniref:TnpV protein n=1 Tax=Ruminococcus sp. TaxID=41978 RepID=UPI0025EDB53F|nr:TnpV protein [Ruminococcus sp.]MBD9047441.1 TnpV protein [Ruminococcus sp.]